MRAKDLLKLSTRTFRTRSGRTALTVLGISVGIGAIVTFVSLGYGLQKTMLEQITTAESLLSLDVTTPQEEIISLNKEKITEISEIPEVEKTSPLAILSGQMSLGNLTSDTLFYVCSPSYFKLGGIIAKEGELFQEEDKKKIVISSAVLKSFNLEFEQALGMEAEITLFKSKKTELGEEIEVFPREESYQIVGIIDEEIAGFVYMPIGTLADLQIEEYSQVKVKVAQAELIEEVKGKIIDMGYSVLALSETIEEANKIFTGIQVVLALFGLVALSVAAIGMANTMTVTLLERTNEIGVMKAIGASSKDVGRMFLAESVIMGLFGGVGGITLGFLVSGIFNWGINVVAERLGGQSIDLFFTPLWFIFFIVVFSTLVGFFSGIFPARKAMKMNPLEALRYK